MKRKPKLYLCRKIGSTPNSGVELLRDGRVRIMVDGVNAIPRSLARLLAKRIVQALEER